MANRVVDCFLPIAVSVKSARPHVERKPCSANSRSSVFGQAVEERGDDRAALFTVLLEQRCTGNGGSRPERGRAPNKRAREAGIRRRRNKVHNHRDGPLASGRLRIDAHATDLGERLLALFEQAAGFALHLLRRLILLFASCRVIRCSSCHGAVVVLEAVRDGARCGGHPPKARGGEAADVAHGVVFCLHLGDRSRAHTRRRIRASTPCMKRRHTR